MRLLIIFIVILTSLFILNLYIDITDNRDFIGVFYSGYTDICAVIVGYFIGKK